MTPEDGRFRTIARTGRLARLALLTTLALTAALGGAKAGDRGEAVDLEIVLAVDVSLSMSREELKIQREGYAEAIRSKPVLDAISHGAIGRIAVVYVEWAGEEKQRKIAGWTMIDGPASADAFAARLLAAPQRRLWRTSISSALLYSADQIARSGFVGTRRVIDISGDGPNNEGAGLGEARAAVLARGITINGLPLVLEQPLHQLADIGAIDAYYRDCVIGGPGAFFLSVTSIEQFKEAVRSKLLSEIADGGPAPAPYAARSRYAAPTPAAMTSSRIAADSPKAECERAEEIWRKRYDD